MASVNFEKLKGAAETKAMLRHCDKEERLKHEHSNKQIDKDHTRYNAQMNRSYKQTCEFYDKRIDELDSTTNTNKRKDRVTCMGLSIPFPEGMDDKKGTEWCNKCLNIIRDMYGRQNVVQTYIHFDEKHEYKNAETGEQETSRSHMHVYVIPELEGKLNAKACMSKKRMIELNNRVHQMTESDYGLQFMDGSKTKSDESVTSLKNKSRKRELDEQERELTARRKKLDDEEKKLNEDKSELKARSAELARQQREIQDEIEKRVREALKASLNEADELIRDLKEAIQKIETVGDDIVGFPTTLLNRQLLPRRMYVDYINLATGKGAIPLEPEEAKRRNKRLLRGKDGKPVYEPVKTVGEELQRLQELSQQVRRLPSTMQYEERRNELDRGYGE